MGLNSILILILVWLVTHLLVELYFLKKRHFAMNTRLRRLYDHLELEIK